jgi:GGDEF domain-containing protein
LRISVSAGAAAYLPPGDADKETAPLAVEQAIARADAALYEAKRQGRNRYFCETGDAHAERASAPARSEERVH